MAPRKRCRSVRPQSTGCYGEKGIGQGPGTDYGVAAGAARTINNQGNEDLHPQKLCSDATFSMMIAASSTEHRREPSEWHYSHSRADSTLANRAVSDLPYPSPGRK